MKRLLLLTLLLISVSIPVSSATHSQTSTEQEFHEQVALVTPTGASCSPTLTASAALTAGTSYVLVAGQGSGTQVRVKLSGNGTQILTITNTGVLTLNVAATQAHLLKHSNVSGGYYFAVRFIAPASVGISLECSGSNLQSLWSLPSGATATTLAGLHGRITLSSDANQVFGFVFRAVQSQAAEDGILATQTDKSPPSTQFSWTRLNPAVEIVNSTAAGDGAQPAIGAQKIAAHATSGKYLEQFRAAIGFSSTCSGTMHVSVSTNLNVPWDNGLELINLSATYTATSTGNLEFVADFVQGTLKPYGTTAWSFGTVAITQHGDTITNSLPADVSSARHVRIWLSGCAITKSGPNGYSSGSMYTYSAGAWTELASNDMFKLSFKYYQEDTMTFSASATSQYVGGALYTYTKEEKIDITTPSITLESNFEGAAISGGTLFDFYGTCDRPSCNVREHRLGYRTIPHTASETWTFTLNATSAGRNLIYGGTLINQPSTTTHVSSIAPARTDAASITLKTYQLWVTNDYFTSVKFTVKECQSLAGDGTCNSEGATLTGVLATTTYDDVEQSNYTETGIFYVTGHNVANNVLTVVLSKIGYQEETYEIDVRGRGSQSFTLYMVEESADSGTITRVTLTVEPDPGNFTVPGQALFNITKSTTETIYWAVAKREQSGALILRTDTHPITGRTDTARYPVGRNATASETGAFVIYFVDANTNPLKTVAFIMHDGATFPAQVVLDSAINASLRAQMAVKVQLRDVEEGTTPAEEAQSIIIDAVRFAYDDPLVIPNMYIFAWAAIVAAALARFATRRAAP